MLHWMHPDCKQPSQRIWPGQNASAQQLFRAAKCGALYPSSLLSAPGGQVQQSTRVALLGTGWKADMLRFSGCPNGTGGCPGYPNCEFSIVFADLHTDVESVVDAVNADVVIFDTQHLEPQDVVVQSLFERQHRKQADKDLVGVGASSSLTPADVATWIFYWREAKWRLTRRQQRAFDLEMGVHFFSDILNPAFIARPTELLQASATNFLPFSERPLFAASAISHCGAVSLRDTYIEQLEAILGSQKVHRYGACGELKNFSHGDLHSDMQTLGRYKFYLSFENAIERGYVTEKLFMPLKAGAIPVYLGAPDVPKLMRPRYGPAYINVLDFSSPQELADHLLAVASDEEAFMKYHQWRTVGVEAFNPKFLKLVARQLPPFSTTLDEDAKPLNEKLGRPVSVRRQQCCRVCDAAFLSQVKTARDNGKPRVFTTGAWNASYVAFRLGLPIESARNATRNSEHFHHL